MPQPELPIHQSDSRDHWERWLQSNHSSSPGVRLKLANGAGIRRQQQQVRRGHPPRLCSRRWRLNHRSAPKAAHKRGWMLDAALVARKPGGAKPRTKNRYERAFSLISAS